MRPLTPGELMFLDAELAARTRPSPPADGSNAVELPPAENAAFIGRFLADYARAGFTTGRQVHHAAERAAAASGS